MAKAPAKSATPAKAAQSTKPLRGPVKATPDQVRAQAMSTGGTVTVACKMPVGMNLGHIHGPHKPAVVLRGSDHLHAVGGYGLTHNIGKDEFEKWEREHAWLPAVKNGLIFAMDKGHMAKSMAAEMGPEIKSGFEPIDPENPGDDDRVSDAIAPTEDQERATRQAKDQHEEELEEARETTPDEEA